MEIINLLKPFERAMIVASAVHAGQVDKAGEPYILHPIRVMQQMDTEEERIVALLHDVIEDARGNFEKKFALAELAPFSEPIKNAVRDLTYLEGEDYLAIYIARVKTNPLARKVKIADLYDNLDPRRLPIRTSADLARVLKYHQALEVLL